LNDNECCDRGFEFALLTIKIWPVGARVTYESIFRFN
jgi:hypothetical protein